VVGPLSPDRRGDRRAGTRRGRSRWPPRGRRRSSATTAVAVHPDDDRYRALVGRRVRIPFVERDVPVIADAVVEREFGTGA
jgi:hypothetical protein